MGGVGVKARREGGREGKKEERKGKEEMVRMEEVMLENNAWKEKGK